MANNTGTQIARQSMFKLVTEVLVKEGVMSFKDAIAITNVVVEYVEKGYTKEIAGRMEQIDEHITNKILEEANFNLHIKRTEIDAKDLIG